TGRRPCHQCSAALTVLLVAGSPHRPARADETSRAGCTSGLGRLHRRRHHSELGSASEVPTSSVQGAERIGSAKKDQILVQVLLRWRANYHRAEATKCPESSEAMISCQAIGTLRQGFTEFLAGHRETAGAFSARPRLLVSCRFQMTSVCMKSR